MSGKDRESTLEKGSGIPWERWLDLLEPFRQENHKRLAEAAQAIILEQGKSDNPAWWAQSVTVAYEQHLGKRKAGQSCDGLYSVSVSKTLPGSPHEALACWQELANHMTSHRGLGISRGPAVSTTPKWLYWRTGLADGSAISINIQEKPGVDKTSLTINHDRIPEQREREAWRQYWKSLLSRI